MAEIQVERRRTSSATGWAILIVVLVALLGAGWYFVLGPGATTRPDLGTTTPGGTTTTPYTNPSPVPAPTPATPPASAGGAEGAPAPPPAPR